MLPDAMATGGRLSPDHAYPFTGVGLSSEGVEAFEVTTIEATKVALIHSGAKISEWAEVITE